MVKITRTVLSLTIFYGLAAFGLAEESRMIPKSDIDLGPVDYECQEGVLVAPHEEHCELYYLCPVEENIAHLYQCNGTNLFDVHIQGCIIEELVDCGNRTRPFICPSPNGNFPIRPDACEDQYYVCVDDVYSLEVCKTGSIFDATTGNCSTTAACLVASTTSTTAKPTAPGPFECPIPNGQFTSPYNCTEFYVCVENNPYLMQCPPGLYYNPLLGVCDWPYNVPSCNANAETL